MTLYRGETIRIRAVPRDPDTLDPLDPLPARAVVDLWGPQVDRKTQVPTISKIEMIRDTVEQRFYVDIPTTSQAWRPGVWTYRVTATDQFNSIEYGTFRLEA